MYELSQCFHTRGADRKAKLVFGSRCGESQHVTLANHLGKPTVVLRCDFRRLSCTGLSEPYNLMAKNWPRNADIHLDSFVVWASLFESESQVLGDVEPFQATLKAELGTVQKSIDEIAKQVIAGLEAVLKIDSPYPPEYQEVVYKAAS